MYRSPLSITAAIPETEAELWEAQAAAQSIPNTGMAVINDIGDLNDIHPKDKQDVGHRLALLALANTYGRQNLVCSGPTFQSMTIEGDKLRAILVGDLQRRPGDLLSYIRLCGRDLGRENGQAARCGICL